MIPLSTATVLTESNYQFLKILLSPLPVGVVFFRPRYESRHRIEVSEMFLNIYALNYFQEEDGNPKESSKKNKKNRRKSFPTNRSGDFNDEFHFDFEVLQIQ